MDKKYSISLLIFFLIIALFPIHDQAFAYIGPGAGFAILSSFLMIFIAFFLAIVNLISWPLRYFIKIIRGQNAYKNALVDKVVVVGLDGMDAELTQKFMSEGKLPNLKRLQQIGYFSPLRTTCPAISPVAWSSFQTGVNPGKHNIFDFLSPDWKTYLPTLSSAYVGNVSKHISLGKYQIPIGKPSLKLLRRSKPFWNILGDQGIFTNVLRVPITFPPEKGKGLMLSAMCVPDLRGTQGSFTFFTSKSRQEKVHTGGTQIVAERRNGQFICVLPGPSNPVSKKHEELKISFTITVNSKDSATLEINGQKAILKKNEYSDWIKLVFKPALGIKVHGICRFLLKSFDPDLELYVTPINIDPNKPALPISNPPYYATYLAKLQGSYATLGLAEDTWALNERIIDEREFLKQTYDIHQERENMFFNALDRLDKGLLVCVFDTTDRIQHTFMRYLHDDHPANQDRDKVTHKNAIEDLYKRADELIGKVMHKIDNKTALFVISDHGFKAFKRGVNLNAWLHKNGYLHLKEDSQGGEWFDGVDWSKTKAYALGLAGIFLNRKGREGKGIIGSKDEATVLKKELIAKLSGLKDNERNEVAINNVFDSADVMSGPYLNAAPDLIVGYKSGYRASWASVTGTVNEDIFTDNVKAWSGDHCIDPREVPGILFSNQKIDCDSPTLTDLAPTILKLFGVEPPVYMDGASLIQVVGNTKTISSKIIE